MLNLIAANVRKDFSKLPGRNAAFPFLIAAALCLACSAAVAGGLSVNNPIVGMAKVYRVVDGDTYILNVEDPSVFDRLYRAARLEGALEHMQPRYRGFRVRLFGVDTAESVHPDADENSSFGKRVSEVVARQLEGTRVRFRCFDFGRYERAICTLSQGGADVGEWLIRSGFSSYVTAYGNHPWAHQRYLDADTDG
jgi:endonuclease YncB( thermonuclease family)